MTKTWMAKSVTLVHAQLNNRGLGTKISKLRENPFLSEWALLEFQSL